MATVNFAGSVSAQAQTGETVTIKVTQPDATIDTLTIATLADKTFAISKQYTQLGSYSAFAHMDADAQYNAKDSPPVAFSIKGDRTITLTISVV